VLGAATGMSLLLILRNIAAPLIRYVNASGQGQPYEAGGNNLEKLVGSFLMILMGFHVLLFFIMKFMFYHHRGGGVSADGTVLDDDGMATDDGGVGAVDDGGGDDVDTGLYDDGMATDDDGGGGRWF